MPICYVCEKEIKKNCVTLVQGLVERHEGCEPGSKRWMDSKVGRESPLRSFFLRMEKRNGNKKV